MKLSINISHDLSVEQDIPYQTFITNLFITKSKNMKTILVVDDSPAELDMMIAYLTQAGYKIVSANNGEDALAKIIADKPDAVVTDWMMPKMGGLDICRKLKKNPETADIPVVACTAKNRDVDRMWANKQGVNGYVTKPCTQNELVDAVKKLIG